MDMSVDKCVRTIETRIDVGIPLCLEMGVHMCVDMCIAMCVIMSTSGAISAGLSESHSFRQVCLDEVLRLVINHACKEKTERNWR